MNINIDNLTKSYENNKVLNDININLKNITSLAIIGPSGGGKSTLLRILAGLEKPDKGNIKINDWNILFNEKYLKTYRKNIGMLFQAYNLFPHISAIRNITLPLEEVHKINKKEAFKKAQSLLERFQLSKHSNKRPDKLSGGQKQRVAIARALALNSEFLLFDEPTSALDPELTMEVLDMINNLRKENKDLILVTHEMGFARKACEYTIFISEGKIIEHGESERIFTSPKSKELKRFLGKLFQWH
ncbi:MAG: amino acid ABC transporter ATP-binding protein [Firmicutes bacterium]|nr:amino acid ABC transporter ATP-binding protein [Bacillota bacterium]